MSAETSGRIDPTQSQAANGLSSEVSLKHLLGTLKGLGFIPCTVILSIFVSYPLALAATDETCPTRFGELNRKYIGKVKVDPDTEANEFITFRGLESYGDLTRDPRKGRSFLATEGLAPIIEALPAGSVWIDMGAGVGRALQEGLELNPKFKAIGIAYKEPELDFRTFSGESRDAQEALVKQGKLQFFYGKLIEDLASSKELDPFKNKTKFITDYIGPLAYTYDFPRVLQIYVDLLEPGGTLLFTPARNSLRGANGESIELTDWLQKVPGITVEKTEGRGIRLIKKDKNAEIPQNLFLKEEGKGTPPRRVYELK
ncbi:MAG: hypothetical protein EOP06_18875 [Proteobacteria bacterium]|nr:MAG: hypothetical protein EOP06_18875 [Pseudomonadota bacterium]